jgi:antitoxin component YwqK of YwqJK toxin-antitoxin module
MKKTSIEGIAKLSVRSIFGRFCRDLVFDANSHTLESRESASNAKDRQKPPKTIDGSFAIPSIFFTLILCGCAAKAAQNSNDLTTIQIMNRNGFSETISAKERLTKYDKTDFLAAQPYQKVVRVFGKAGQGKTESKVTTYHPNGQPWQYLEIENGRAHGKFIEWHPNGHLKLEGTVIEGTPDVSEMAQLTWFFEGLCLVYDELGHQAAKIFYDKGLLEGPSLYFHPNGSLAQEIPYTKDAIHGLVQLFDTAGNSIEKISYAQGDQDGPAVAHWMTGGLKYKEDYEKGRLLSGKYFNPKGEKIAEVVNGEGAKAVFDDVSLISLVECHQGAAEGLIQNFNSKGQLVSAYSIKGGMKQGEEWEYYPSDDRKPQPKLCLFWNEDTLEGPAKTWYENGVLESQREMQKNQKQGPAYAWYKEGDLMLVEEYENDQLVKGSYFKKWEKNPISKIENGKGIATLFDKEGKLLKKVAYEKSLPQNEG